jgi:hypothetical protein
MLAILILGSSALLGGFLFPLAAGTPSSRPPEARPALPPADSETSAPFHARGSEPSPKSGVVCTLRVLRADPSLDPGIVVTMERQVDPEMVISSPCARSTEAAGKR